MFKSLPCCFLPLLLPLIAIFVSQLTLCQQLPADVDDLINIDDDNDAINFIGAISSSSASKSDTWLSLMIAASPIPPAVIKHLASSQNIAILPADGDNNEDLLVVLLNLALPPFLVKCYAPANTNRPYLISEQLGERTTWQSVNFDLLSPAVERDVQFLPPYQYQRLRMSIKDADEQSFIRRGCQNISLTMNMSASLIVSRKKQQAASITSAIYARYDNVRFLHGDYCADKFVEQEEKRTMTYLCLGHIFSSNSMMTSSSSATPRYMVPTTTITSSSSSSSPSGSQASAGVALHPSDMVIIPVVLFGFLVFALPFAYVWRQRVRLWCQRTMRRCSAAANSNSSNTTVTPFGMTTNIATIAGSSGTTAPSNGHQQSSTIASSTMNRHQLRHHHQHHRHHHGQHQRQHHNSENPSMTAENGGAGDSGALPPPSYEQVIKATTATAAATTPTSITSSLSQECNDCDNNSSSSSSEPNVAINMV